MSRAAHRVQLTRAYVLYQRPFRDSSLIVETFTRDHGRMTVFARGVRGPRPRFGALQPFQPLLLSWSGRGDAPQLTAAESVDGWQPALPPEQFLSGSYLNELLLTLTTRHDPHPELFDQYAATVLQLKSGAPADASLRQFEARLLELIGYGLNLLAEADTGQPVQADAYYRYRPGVHGLVRAAAGSAGAVSGLVLLRLAGIPAAGEEADARQARALMRAAIDHCLDGRELRTRLVARSLANFPRKERTVR